MQILRPSLRGMGVRRELLMVRVGVGAALWRLLLEMMGWKKIIVKVKLRKLIRLLMEIRGWRGIKQEVLRKKVDKLNRLGVGFLKIES